MKNLKHTVIAAISLCCLGCGDDTSYSGSTAEVLQRWSKAGLDTTTFKAFDGAKLEGGECERGVISGVQVTLCHYPSVAEASSAQAAGLAMVGSRTGAALAQGQLLLVVADRSKADRSGRVINRITRAFRGR